MREHVMKTDPQYLLVNLYQTIAKVWLWKMVVRHIAMTDLQNIYWAERSVAQCIYPEDTSSCRLTCI